jgi:glycosyltransferase involved in cell wall biosynthesis
VNVCLVSPAWGRFDVTRMVLAERRWMCDELALRGLQVTSVIVADDENLEIAEEYGFDTVEMGNLDLGAKFNAGYRYAAGQGADVFVHCGSDDWIHPDAFNILAETNLNAEAPMPDPTPGNPVVWRRSPSMVSQRRILLVDLSRGQAQRCFVHGRYGCIPWMIPRKALQPEGFAPIGPGHMRGIDGALVRGLTARPTFVFQDAPDEWCVDFKSATNVTPYRGLASALGVGDEEDAWPMLAEFYPEHLIDMARSLAA